MNISETLLKTLKHLIFPLISLLISLVLYFVFISPFSSYISSFETLRQSYEKSNSNLQANIKVLEKVRNNQENILKLQENLKSLVPESANPSEITGLIDNQADAFRFRSTDENRSITSAENDRNKLIEVRYNGRSPGVASSINFLKALTINNEKLIKITRLELTNNPEELFTRISFNAFSIFSQATPKVSNETPIIDLFEDSNFMKLLNSVSSE